MSRQLQRSLSDSRQQLSRIIAESSHRPPSPLSGGNQGSVPWGNCRLVLSSATEGAYRRHSGSGHAAAGGEEDMPRGIVARLYFSTATHPVIRQILEGFELRKISLPALGVQNLMNNRGPDALVGRIPGEEVHSGQLLELCRLCHDEGLTLVSRTRDVDVVLVPRNPEVAAKDSLYFLVYATNVKAVELCEALRRDRQVAVVLDVDNTLIDATLDEGTHDEEDEEDLKWIRTEVETSTGQKLEAKFAHVPGSEDGDATQDRVFVMAWTRSGVEWRYRVRVRRGWGLFRAYLLDNLDKYLVFLCSKGKKEYVELIWQGLDPGSRIIPRDAWHTRVSSTYPDTLVKAAHKTALIALSCSTVHDQYAETHLAAPFICIDDSPDTYEEPYRSSVLLVEEYSPSDGGPADTGSVMQCITDKLSDYWEATCGELGTFAWQAALSFSTAILGAMQRTPMESPDALSYLQDRCSKQGELLWRQITVEYVLGSSAATGFDLKKVPSMDSPKSVRLAMQGSGGSLSQLPHRQSLDSRKDSIDAPTADEMRRAAQRDIESLADDLVHANMMMQC